MLMITTAIFIRAKLLPKSCISQVKVSSEVLYSIRVAVPCFRVDEVIGQWLEQEVRYACEGLFPLSFCSTGKEVFSAFASYCRT